MRVSAVVTALCIFSPFLGLAQDAYNAGITLSPDERTIAVGNASNEIRLFRTQDDKLLRTFKLPLDGYFAGFFTKPAFSPDGKYLTAADIGPDGGMNPVWRVSDGKVMAQAALMVAKSGGYGMSAVGFSERGDYLLGSLWPQGLPAAFEAKTGRLAYLGITEGSDQRNFRAAVSPKGSLIAHLVEDRFGVEFWDPLGKQAESWSMSEVKEFPDGGQYLAFSGDGQVLIVAGDGWCARLDPRTYPKEGIVIDTGRGIDTRIVVKKSETVKDFLVRSVCSSNNGDHAFLGSRDGRIAQFDLRTGRALRVWKAFDEPVKGLALTKDGKTLYAFDLQTLSIWVAPSWQRARTIKTGMPRR